MRQQLGLVTFLVRDYDEAIVWFTEVLRFTLAEDTALSPEKRWVRVLPPGVPAGGAGLLLARAATAEQVATVGQQGGGRVWLFLYTDDFARDHAEMAARGVAFAGPPRREAYGAVAVFLDLYGNKWDLIGPA